jgi:hypothetical protein
LSRHAISTLQIRLLSNTAESHLNPHQPQLPSLSREGDDKNLIGRDKSFSMLHGIGKLLHSRLGKRREERRERRGGEGRGEERRERRVPARGDLQLTPTHRESDTWPTQL